MRIQRYHADRTNQKLYFARLAYQNALQQDNLQLRQAQQESAIFHLYGAITAFLHEIIRFYRLPNTLTAQLEDLSPLTQALAEKQHISPELNQLQELYQTGLKTLCQAYHACLHTPEPATVQPETEQQNLIIRIQNHTTWLPEIEQLQHWHQQLSKFFDHCREQMVEY